MNMLSPAVTDRLFHADIEYQKVGRVTTVW
jgi:hypothetical protein